MFQRLGQKRNRPWGGERYWTTKVIGKRQPSTPGRAYYQGAIRISEATIATIVKHSFTIAVFQIRKTILRQKRGSLIGFPLSAALCVMTVMETEMKLGVIPRPLFSRGAWVGVRYVDNLLTLHLRKQAIDTLPKDLFNLQFYGTTVVLEFEKSLQYLGLEVQPKGHTFEMAYVVPGYKELLEAPLEKEPSDLYQEKWRYRSARAGCSDRMKLVGFSSRLHTAARCAFPRHQCRIGILKLVSVAVILGHCNKELLRIIRKQAKAYATVYGDGTLSLLQTALNSDREECMRILRHRLSVLTYH